MNHKYSWTEFFRSKSFPKFPVFQIGTKSYKVELQFSIFQLEIKFKTGKEMVMTISINVPSNAVIGRYDAKFYTRGDTDPESYSTATPKRIYILANPFDKNGGCFYDGSYKGQGEHLSF